jgi:hypothetical protein
MILGLLRALGSASFIACIASTTAYPVDLRVTLRPSQDTYAIREPVKFAITIENAGSTEARVMEVRELGANMEYTFLDIQTPDGTRELRAFQYVSDIKLQNPNYLGEPLRPSEGVQFFIYPTESTPLLGDPRNEAEDYRPLTFPVAGTYHVRVAYRVPKVYKNLQPAGGEVLSESVVLKFKDPTPEESEILDAIWACVPMLSSGDDHLLGCQAESEIRRVIELYPRNDLTRYARFYLARFIVDEFHPQQWGEAIEILEDLRSNHPSFRAEEVRLLLGRVYGSSGEPEKARQVLNEALAGNPMLRTNFRFMGCKISTEYADSNPGEALGIWMENRRMGKPNPEDIKIE